MRLCNTANLHKVLGTAPIYIIISLNKGYIINSNEAGVYNIWRGLYYSYILIHYYNIYWINSIRWLRCINLLNYYNEGINKSNY